MSFHKIKTFTIKSFTKKILLKNKTFMFFKCFNKIQIIPPSSTTYEFFLSFLKSFPPKCLMTHKLQNSVIRRLFHLFSLVDKCYTNSLRLKCKIY